jgi:hypothetical protein
MVSLFCILEFSHDVTVDGVKGEEYLLSDKNFSVLFLGVQTLTLLASLLLFKVWLRDFVRIGLRILHLNILQILK